MTHRQKPEQSDRSNVSRENDKRIKFDNQLDTIPLHFFDALVAA
jgi:hypothetical protein